MKQILTFLIVGGVLWYGFSQVTQQVAEPTVRGISSQPDLTIDGVPVTDVFAFSNASVLDGDSFRLEVDEQQIDIRLASIDAPELQQPFGSEAGQNLQRLIGSNEIIAWEIGLDQYGRHLAHLFIEQPDGQLFEINSQMIRDGYAWHYRQHSDNPILDSLEATARSSRLGLWNDFQAPVPPWEFRQQ